MAIVHSIHSNNLKSHPITLLLQDGRTIIVEIIPDACDASTLMIKYRCGEVSRMPRGDVKACSVVAGWGVDCSNANRSAA